MISQTQNKRKLFTFLSLLVCCAVILASSATKKSAELKYLPKDYRKSFAFIPEGEVLFEGTSQQCSSFYIQKTEVSNLDYRIFLNDSKGKLSTGEFELALLDTLGWRTELRYGEPIIDYYHAHPAYDDYPVVNVSIEGAELYCKWLEENLNQSNPLQGKSYEVSLPKRSQWVRATRPNYIQSVYTWGGPYTMNSQGCLLCNYYSVSDGCISYNEEKNVYEITGDAKEAYYSSIGNRMTAPCLAYPPSELGLYNMNGNVGEMTVDRFVCGGNWKSGGYDVRNESVVAYKESASTIGFRPIIELVSNK